MNCKPGDRAVIFRALYDDRHFNSSIGAVIVCSGGSVEGRFTWPDGSRRWIPSWIPAEPLACRCCGGHVTAVPDEVLKPLPPENDVWRHDYEQKDKELRVKLGGLADVIDAAWPTIRP